jgi:hypothetical protein
MNVSRRSPEKDRSLHVAQEYLVANCCEFTCFTARLLSKVADDKRGMHVVADYRIQAQGSCAN